MPTASEKTSAKLKDDYQVGADRKEKKDDGPR